MIIQKLLGSIFLDAKPALEEEAVGVVARHTSLARVGHLFGAPTFRHILNPRTHNIHGPQYFYLQAPTQWPPSRSYHNAPVGWFELNQFWSKWIHQPWQQGQPQPRHIGKRLPFSDQATKLKHVMSTSKPGPPMLIADTGGTAMCVSMTSD